MADHRALWSSGTSQEAPLREAEHSVGGDNQMVQHTHIDQRERGGDAFGDDLVGVGLVFDAAGMVIGDDVFA